MSKLNEKNEIFCENHSPTRHIKYKVIIFTSKNNSSLAYQLPSTNSEEFLILAKPPLTC